jgi:hypothetical protein
MKVERQFRNESRAGRGTGFGFLRKIKMIRVVADVDWAQLIEEAIDRGVFTDCRRDD